MSSPGSPLLPVPLTPTPPPAPPSDTGADYTGTNGRLYPEDPDDDDMDDADDSTSAPAAAVLSNLTATSRLNRVTASSLSNLSFNQKQSVLRAMFASRAGNTSMSLTKDQAQERIRQAKMPPPPNPSPLKAVVSKSMPMFAGEEDEENTPQRSALPPPPPPPPALILCKGVVVDQSIQLHLPRRRSPTHAGRTAPGDRVGTARARATAGHRQSCDKLMAQTVQSFEKCLHHAMDVSAQIMAHVARRPAAVAAAAAATVPAPGLAWHATAIPPAAWPAAPSPTACACGRPASPNAQSPARAMSTERTSEREMRLLAQLDEIAALVQVSTDRHAQITKLLADQTRDRAMSQADREMGDLVNLVRWLAV
ncbi:hypothetical protein AMAG_04345 [Allomyces macrogynus ATCC 38327]|uniref:Uncharacterized protein n=1 Tax=Allomyces macrogynus (strain ATCC 38327) TaxID=578462 RepID=A0A0L0S8R3_ALLM3|nr:hypothetical protein AMAG_04345 [Allomyces macrogynus ATCC 38327]|eukprot:KNE58795.1 hypothetical protein AMAG_04345 [Allomyces macrogynus ATCC 38327]